MAINLATLVGLSLASMQASLKGYRGEHAHAGELGTALRKLGFERKRKRRDGDSFKGCLA